MTIEGVVWLAQQTLLTALLIAGPLLLIALAVGFLVGIFQAVTSIHEATLAIVPKIFAVVATLGLCLPWMLRKLLDFAVHLFNTIPAVMR